MNATDGRNPRPDRGLFVLRSALIMVASSLAVLGVSGPIIGWLQYHELLRSERVAAAILVAANRLSLLGLLIGATALACRVAVISVTAMSRITGGLVRAVATSGWPGRIARLGWSLLRLPLLPIVLLAIALAWLAGFLWSPGSLLIPALRRSVFLLGLAWRAGECLTKSIATHIFNACASVYDRFRPVAKRLRGPIRHIGRLIAAIWSGLGAASAVVGICLRRVGGALLTGLGAFGTVLWRVLLGVGSPLFSLVRRAGAALLALASASIHAVGSMARVVRLITRPVGRLLGALARITWQCACALGRLVGLVAGQLWSGLALAADRLSGAAAALGAISIRALSYARRQAGQALRRLYSVGSRIGNVFLTTGRVVIEHLVRHANAAGASLWRILRRVVIGFWQLIVALIRSLWRTLRVVAEFGRSTFAGLYRFGRSALRAVCGAGFRLVRLAIVTIKPLVGAGWSALTSAGRAANRLGVAVWSVLVSVLIAALGLVFPIVRSIARAIELIGHRARLYGRWANRQLSALSRFAGEMVLSTMATVRHVLAPLSRGVQRVGNRAWQLLIIVTRVAGWFLAACMTAGLIFGCLFLLLRLGIALAESYAWNAVWILAGLFLILDLVIGRPVTRRVGRRARPYTLAALASGREAMRWVIPAMGTGLAASKRALLWTTRLLTTLLTAGSRGLARTRDYAALAMYRLWTFGSAHRRTASRAAAVAVTVGVLALLAVAPVQRSFAAVDCRDSRGLLGLGAENAATTPPTQADSLLASLQMTSWSVWASIAGETRAAYCFPPDTVVVAYSPEKGPLFRELVASFEASRPPSEPRLVAVQLETADMLENALDGKLTAISPDSDVWLSQLEGSWERRNPGSAPLVISTAYFAASPLVIAMRESEARRMGYPEVALGWEHVANRASDDSGFRWSHPAPSTATGLFATTAVYYAGAGKQQGLTLADLAASGTSSYVTAVEGTIRRYGGESEDQMLERLLAGASPPDAFVVQEQFVVQYNRQAQGPRLVAIYPHGGTFELDHPLILLNRPGLTERQRTKFGELADYLNQPVARQAVLRAGYRAGRDAALPDGSVSPVRLEDRIDPGQPGSILAVPSPDILEEIRLAWRLSKRPANIYLVVDVSGSMGGEKIASAREALVSFVDQVKSDRERVGLITFSGEVREVVPLRPLAENRESLRIGIRDLRPGGETALNDAVLRAFIRLQEQRDPERINAIVVMTDGRDTSSRASLADLVVRTRAADPAVLIFTVAYGDDADTATLQEIAEATDGQSYTSYPATVRRLYELVARSF